MDDLRGPTFGVATDPTVADRFAALERVRHARQALDAERERAELAAARATDAATEPVRLDPGEVEHLVEIHRSIELERRAARRPFARRNGPEIMALEMAERLVLDRLGFASYADVEADVRVAEVPAELIDLTELARLEHELEVAETQLARLSVGADALLAPPLPRRRRPGAAPEPVRPESRTTAARKEVFGTTSGWAPRRSPGASAMRPPAPPDGQPG